MNILIADDVPLNLKLLRAELEAGGHTVFDAPNGAEALKILEREKIDAIISDILMPVMDGYRFCQEVRKDGRFQLIPFVFYTATYVSTVDEKFGLSLGADKFLHKPVSGRIILETLAGLESGQQYKSPRVITAPQEIDIVKEYSERLVAKLEQKNTELAEYNERLLLQGAALETTANGVMITDTEGIIQWVNPAFTTLTGYTAEEAVGNHTRMLKSGRQSQEFYKELWDTILVGRTWRGSFVNRRKDGSLYYDEHTITPVKSGAGVVEHFVTIMHDVTERRRAEEALRETEKKYRDIFDNCIEGIFQTTPDGRYINANPALARIYGYESPAQLMADLDDISGKLYMDFQRRQEFMRLVQERGSVSDFESQVRRKDGRIIWISEKARVVRDGRHAVLYYEGTVEDVTERKRAEEAMRESEKKFRSVFDAANDGIFIIKDGVFVQVNAQGAEMIGWSGEEIVGSGPDKFSPPIQPDGRDSREKAMELIQAALAGTPQFFEWTLVSKDGTRFEGEVSVSRFELGGEWYLQAIVRDITERKRAEEALRLFRALIDRLDDAIHVIDPETGRFIDFNETACARLGYSREEMLSMSLPEIAPGMQVSVPEMAEDLRKAGFKIIESRHRRKDGSTFPVEINVRYVQLDRDYIVSTVRDITARKKAEERERRQQAMLSSAVRIAELGSWDYDIRNERLEWSEETHRIFGVVPGEFGGTIADFLAMVHHEDVEKMRAIQVHSLATGGPVDLEYRIRRPNGDERILYDRGETICDQAGKPAHRIGVVMDITERKQMEETLKERMHLAELEAEVGTVLTQGGTLAETLRLCSDAIVRHLNVAFARIWTLNETEKMLELQASSGMYTHLNGPHSRVPVGTLKIGLIASEKKPHLTNHVIGDPRVGDQEWAKLEGMVAFAGYPLLVEDHVLGVVAMFTRHTLTDVTLRALDSISNQIAVCILRDRSEQQNRKLAALLDQTQDAITVRDLQGRIMFWNKGAAKMLGWTSDEATGRNFCELVQENKTDYEKAVETVLTQGEWSKELQIISKDGRKLTVESRWTLVRDPKGGPDSILAINTDVTEKKKIEAQFLRAQRMESIGTLASGVAHDLNNILAPIMMSIEILKEIPEGEQKRRILETIEASAQRGAEIVQQVLSFGRGMEGKRVEVQAKHLLKDVERIVRDTFPKDIRLHISAARDSWSVLGDPTQLYQVLLNLCVNSRDAMPDGGDILIEIKNFTVDDNFAVVNLHARPGPHVLIEVTDTGAGIPKGVIEKIFDPFFTTKELGKGTGLGLSTAMAIVKSHGGFVNVYSEPGKGTTFRVYLPALTAQRAGEAEAESASLPRGDGETVLLVDDEASILTIARQTLEAFGYKVLTADNGAAAIALYAQHMNVIAVVLTDMMMPVMDGKATIHALKTINPEIKIIAASGLNANGVIAGATDSGVKHFLTKPYTAATLLKMFRMVLDEDSQVSL